MTTTRRRRRRRRIGDGGRGSQIYEAEVGKMKGGAVSVMPCEYVRYYGMIYVRSML